MWGWLLLYLAADGLLAFGFNGFAFQYLLGEHPLWNDMITPAAATVSTISALRFFSQLFGVRKSRHVRIWRWLRLLEAIAVAGGCLGMADALGIVQAGKLAGDLLERDIVVVTITLLALSIRHALRGVAGARWQVLGFLIVVGSTATLVARNQGLISTGSVIDYLWQFNVVIHAIVIGTGVYVRYASLMRRRIRFARLMQRTRLEQKLVRQQERFVAKISHEFRAPLSVIDIVIRNLLREDRLSGHARDESRKIQRAQISLIALTDNFLNDEAISHTNFRHHPQPFALLPWVAALLRERQALFEHRTLIVAMRHAPESLTADRDLLQIALSNLLSNAIAYSQPGSRVVLRIWRGTDAIMFALRDRGTGIDAANVSRLFGRYFRAADAADYGAGIGLHLVRRIAELHGGSIRLRSTKGIGTTVIMRIPAMAP